MLQPYHITTNFQSHSLCHNNLWTSAAGCPATYLTEVVPYNHHNTAKKLFIALPLPFVRNDDNINKQEFLTNVSAWKYIRDIASRLEAAPNYYTHDFTSYATQHNFLRSVHKCEWICSILSQKDIVLLRLPPAHGHSIPITAKSL